MSKIENVNAELARAFGTVPRSPRLGEISEVERNAYRAAMNKADRIRAAEVLWR
jgi:hypothetical protein